MHISEGKRDNKRGAVVEEIWLWTLQKTFMEITRCTLNMQNLLLLSHKTTQKWQYKVIKSHSLITNKQKKAQEGRENSLKVVEQMDKCSLIRKTEERQTLSKSRESLEKSQITPQNSIKVTNIFYHTSGCFSLSWWHPLRHKSFHVWWISIYLFFVLSHVLSVSHLKHHCWVHGHKDLVLCFPLGFS